MGLTGGAQTRRRRARAVGTKKVSAHKGECTSTGFCHGPCAQECSEESSGHKHDALGFPERVAVGGESDSDSSCIRHRFHQQRS